MTLPDLFSIVTDAPSGLVENDTGYFVDVKIVAHELREKANAHNANNLNIVFISAEINHTYLSIFFT